jgi:hypothetical protein
MADAQNCMAVKTVTYVYATRARGIRLGCTAGVLGRLIVQP